LSEIGGLSRIAFIFVVFSGRFFSEVNLFHNYISRLFSQSKQTNKIRMSYFDSFFGMKRKLYKKGT
jgi:hypothetical protein